MAEIIPVDTAASEAGGRLQQQYSAVIPASDYTWFLYGRSELPVDRLFYWRQRIQDHARRLFNEGKINADLYKIINELAFVGLLWVPRWRGGGELGHQSAVALFDALGFMAIRNEYVTEAAKYTAAAGKALARNVALYDTAYAVVSALSITEAVNKLRDAAAKLATALQSVNEMENRAVNNLPPEKAQSFINDNVSPIKVLFGQAQTIVKDTGLTPQEAGMGWLVPAAAIAVSIAAITVTYLATYAQRKAASARDVLTKMIEDNAKNQLVTIDNKYNNILLSLSPTSSPEQMNAIIAQRDAEKAAVKDDAAKKLAEALKIPLPKTGLPDLGDIGIGVIAAGLAVVVIMFGPSIFGKK